MLQLVLHNTSHVPREREKVKVMHKVTELNGLADTQTQCISWEKPQASVLPYQYYKVHTLKLNGMVAGYNHKGLAHEEIQNMKYFTVYKN
jgi:hypothetical protein